MKKYKIYAKTIEQEAIDQIEELANSPLGENAHIRIMPDAHAGAGCVIGTTMKITDKVCPNIVGVDIGCGVLLAEIVEDLSLEEIDKRIKENVPSGRNTHEEKNKSLIFLFERLYCWDKLGEKTKELAYKSLGTLGGGNHFIEVYRDETATGMTIHSGSRNIGYKVAEYYQNLAEKRIKEKRKANIDFFLHTLPPSEREQKLKEIKKEPYNAKLAYLEGKDMQDYLHDMKIMQEFARQNRLEIYKEIVGHVPYWYLDTVHNYIDMDKMILRKGSVSAEKGELFVLPLNMRDGILLCRGKGNKEWNCSAPHGAGRLYSRAEAKRRFNLEEYQESMDKIFTTSVNENTIDEAPFVYKNEKEIMEAIEPTATIINRLRPSYNFKASE